MAALKRLYDMILLEHLAMHRQMAFVVGPRQVGKTTTCRECANHYCNWDKVDDRDLILSGPAKLVAHSQLSRLKAKLPTLLFDELHRYHGWKKFLKGFFDSYADQTHVVVTGSSRMGAYRRGSDSLMGRYFPYRMHPLTVAELIWQDLPELKRVVRSLKPLKAAEFDALWTHGGYPEPFLKRDSRFSRRWQSLRFEQLVREDIRDLTRIQQLDQVASLVRILANRSAHQLIFRNLAHELRASTDTVTRWVEVLRALHLGFLIRPWFKSVSRSLRKEPKWFLRDWSSIDDLGVRAATFVGCHLLEAVETWTDLGFGKFDLGYLRDKEKREVDFVVTRDGKPWFSSR